MVSGNTVFFDHEIQLQSFSDLTLSKTEKGVCWISEPTRAGVAFELELGDNEWTSKINPLTPVTYALVRVFWLGTVE